MHRTRCPEARALRPVAREARSIAKTERADPAWPGNFNSISARYLLPYMHDIRKRLEVTAAALLIVVEHVTALRTTPQVGAMKSWIEGTGYFSSLR